MLAYIKATARQLAGVHLVGDLYERACDSGMGLPLDAKRRQKLQAIDQARTLFIHVPKNAGMSISAALYNRQIKHATIRYYRQAAPRMVRRTTSFAVLRDPVERFVSALCYAQAGGSGDNVVSAPFRERYRAFQCADDALDHLENTNSIYEIDHIFRPQSWYITDRHGRVIVDRLFVMHDMAGVREFLRLRCAAELVHLNAGNAPIVGLSADQIGRVQRLYARDVELFEMLCARSRAASRQIADAPSSTPAVYAAQRYG